LGFPPSVDSILSPAEPNRQLAGGFKLAQLIKLWNCRQIIVVVKSGQ